LEIVKYLSNLAIPFTILAIILFGLTERIKVFDVFLEGAKEGTETVIKIFPTLIGLFMAIGLLRNSGVLGYVINLISPITDFLHIPKEIMPLAMLRPISGSGALAIGTDIMRSYGVDSRIGLIASTIMGSTETTFYTVAVYTSIVGIKKTRFVLMAALVGDLIGVLVSVFVCQFLL